MLAVRLGLHGQWPLRSHTTGNGTHVTEISTFTFAVSPASTVTPNPRQSTQNVTLGKIFRRRLVPRAIRPLDSDLGRLGELVAVHSAGTRSNVYEGRYQHSGTCSIFF